MADFKIAYLKTGKNEGGFSNDPADSGGKTYAGITEKNYPKWRGWAILKRYEPLKQGQRVNDPELDKAVFEFYYENFWAVVGGDAMEDQELANQVYDMAVNAGDKTSLNILNES